MIPLIQTIAEGFSATELTSILRAVSHDSSVSDAVIRVYASALCLTWMDLDNLKEIIKCLEADNKTYSK